MQKAAGSFVKKLIDDLLQNGVEVRGDSEVCAISGRINQASLEDWETEYLDKIVSIKFVGGVEGAIDHIAKYGSYHTEGILAKDREVIEHFRRSVDASCIVVNASTRFNDGGELGLGAEIGISTTKFHAYGPMGAAELTARRYLVEGEGHIRS